MPRDPETEPPDNPDDDLLYAWIMKGHHASTADQAAMALGWTIERVRYALQGLAADELVELESA